MIVLQEELCLKWILALPLPRLKEVLGELRWLHPQELQDLPEDEAESLMTRCRSVLAHFRTDTDGPFPGKKKSEKYVELPGKFRDMYF